MPLRDAIERALTLVGEQAAEDELAYLALTAKIEYSIRDRLTYQLHTALWPTRLVARELNRRDLAVLSNPPDRLLAIVELKQMYSFDAFSAQTDTSEYPRQVLTDIDKGRAAGADELFALLLSTHADLREARAFERVVKYVPHMRRAVKDAELGEIRRAAAENMERWLDESRAAVGPWTEGSIEGGSAFGIPVQIDYWLIGPTPM